jgi:hypothetical protein
VTMRARSLTIVAGLAVVALTTVAIAVETTGQPAEVEVYSPVTSDLMNEVIQPRHIKLWLAGKAQNWEFADYERHNLGGAFGRLEKAIPEYKGHPVSDLIATFVTPQLDELAAAIKAKDPAAFKTAYEGLTTGCNQCHQATGHAFVVLQTPGSDGYPDQVFRPQ